MRKLLVLGIATAAGLFGQVFEVVSVRPNTGGGSYGMRVTPGRFTATNVTTLMLVRRAFGVEAFQVEGGPKWLDADRFDVEAVAPGAGEIQPDVLGEMLQSLLAERFGLKVHRESREMPGYSLVPGKKVKLIAHQGDEVPSLKTEYSQETATMVGGNTTMTEFAKALSRLPGGPVRDDTGLKGGFDFRLEWSPGQTGEAGGASLFSAVQDELGLRLIAGKVNVEFIRIDQALRPSGN